jgi:hypothetical protein
MDTGVDWTRQTPNAAMAASPPSARNGSRQRGQNRSRAPSGANAAKMSSASSVRPCRPMRDATCAVASNAPKACPKLFHGKPVNTQDRSHSISAMEPAKANTRRPPPLHIKRASTNPSP